MAKKEITRLFNVKFGKKGEISLVNAGANKREILLTKSEEESMEELLKELLESDFENEKQFDEKLSKLLPASLKKEDTEKVTAGLKGAFSILSKIKDDLPKEERVKVLSSLLKDAGFDIEPAKELPEFSKFVAEQMKKEKISEEELSKATEIPVEVIKAMASGEISLPPTDKFEGLVKALKSESETMLKLFPENVQKMYSTEEPVSDPKKKEDDKTEITKGNEAVEDLKKELTEKYDKVVVDLKKENETLTKNLTKETSLRLEKEFESKAKEFGYEGEKAVEIGKSLKEANELMSETGYKTFEEQIQKSGETLKNADLFKELGAGGAGEKDVEAQIKVKTDELMKADTKLTKEQAESQVYEKFPALYNEYLDSNPKQGGY